MKSEPDTAGTPPWEQALPKSVCAQAVAVNQLHALQGVGRLCTAQTCSWEVPGTPKPLLGSLHVQRCAVIPQVKSSLNCISSGNINVQSCTKLCMRVISSNVSINIAWLGGRRIFLVQLQKCLGQQDILCGSRLLSTWKMHDGFLGRIGYILLLWITVWMSQAIFCHVWSLRYWRMVISAWTVH